jgi:hypothetical protein
MFDKEKFESQAKSAIGFTDADFDYSDFDDHEDYGSIVVKVDIKNLKTARENWHKNKYEPSLILKSRTPPLVPAKLNDIVIAYREYANSEEDLGVGVVSSIHETPNGICYGCRHIELKPSSIFGFGEIELTSENYGGYPGGFYKVLDREEGIALLVKKVKEKLQEKIDAATKRMGEVEQDIIKELDLMQKATPTKSIRVLCKDEIRPNTYD